MAKVVWTNASYATTATTIIEVGLITSRHVRSSKKLKLDPILYVINLIPQVVTQDMLDE